MTLIFIEKEFFKIGKNFTPSTHSLCHLIHYLQTIGPLSHHSTSIFERSYKMVKKVTISCNHIPKSIFNTLSLINQLYVYTYKKEDKKKRKYNIIVNEFQNITDIFSNYNVYNYSIITYLDKDIMTFGIIREIIDKDNFYIINKKKLIYTLAFTGRLTNITSLLQTL